MLKQLVIQNFVLIDRLTVPFHDGLHAFTGETGAGKSIALDALGLVLGARADANLIRSGHQQATVTAEFTPPLPPALLALLEEQGFAIEDDLILRRTLSTEGKSKAFLNDQPISIKLLRDIGSFLLEIHGQFETRGLMDPANHRRLLDLFGNSTDTRNKTANAHKRWKQTCKAYNDAIQNQAKAEQEQEFLRTAVAELDALNPQQGEDESLTEKRKQLQDKEKILSALETAEQALGQEKSAQYFLGEASRALARIETTLPSITPILDSIKKVTSDLEEASFSLSTIASSFNGKEMTLQKIEDRFFALRGMARKYHVTPEELPNLKENFDNQLQAIDDKEGFLKKLTKEKEAAQKIYEETADKLTQQRTKHAKNLAKEVMKELPPLKLEKATFMVELTPLGQDHWGEEGKERIDFIATTNPGSKAGALQKIASGGELSRFMLALKVVLAASDPVPTLVFDEVDAGIGGATASAVGERLAKLSRDVQILVVTHSPQVAALAETHYHVAKTTTKNETTTNIQKLSAKDKEEEIARMLAGNTITTAAREAAKSLITEGEKQAAKNKKKA